MGFAYTAPATLKLRAELGVQAPTTATLEHGARVEILETRRRFVRVRAANGAEGWTDSALLLTQAQIDDLKALAERANAIPSQGTATVYDALNVHTAASRSAPNVLQLQAGETFEVVAHRVTPRIAAAPAARAVMIQKEQPEQRDKKKTDAPEMPRATPPLLPHNWEQLSRPRMADLTKSPALPRQTPLADDWFLVRTPQGRAGWALMRAVLMQVPDEVAQYAERHLITSYHNLGETHTSKGERKNHWLWTTLAKGLQPYDFDSLRVFVYNSRRERYETALIERNLKGYFPVETSTAPDGTTISLLVEDKDGRLQKRTYLFDRLRVRMMSKAPASLPLPLPEVRPAAAFDAVATGDGGWLKGLARKWFGE
jgi:hypothetical protein